MVVRDDRRYFIAALKCREHLVSESYQILVSESYQIKALLAVTATRFAKELGLQHIILERDCLSVIQALQMISPNSSSIGHLIEEVKGQHLLFSTI